MYFSPRLNIDGLRSIETRFTARQAWPFKEHLRRDAKLGITDVKELFYQKNDQV